MNESLTWQSYIMRKRVFQDSYLEPLKSPKQISQMLVEVHCFFITKVGLSVAFALFMSKEREFFSAFL